MRHHITLSAVLLASVSLSGCAQINSAANWIAKPFKGELRDAPKPEWETVSTENVTQTASVTGTTTFPSSSYSSSTYSSGSTFSSGSTVSTGQFYGVDDAQPTISAANVAAPQTVSYVRLNGTSRMSDWQNCERLHNGYWRIDAAGGRIDPGFEVCMRNKGYVRESELALYGFGAGEPSIAGPSTRLAGGFAAF